MLAERYESEEQEAGIPAAESPAGGSPMGKNSPPTIPGLPEAPSAGELPEPKRRTKKLAKAESPRVEPVPHRTPEEKLMLLDVWGRSGLAAKDFAPLVSVTPARLYAWKRKFVAQGPEGLLDVKPKASPKGSRLPEMTKRAILMVKQEHPEWGCRRISDMLARGPALGACETAVRKVLHEAGYEPVDIPTKPNPPVVKRFERAAANQLWQTDIFTFMLKRQNTRVHLIAFLDDYSRYVVSYGLHSTASAALVKEVLRAGIASYRQPEEVLTDNGPQYKTWRGKSAFTRELEKLGIRHIVSRPRHPQTLGKTERFWGTLWRECVQRAIFLDLDDARKRIGLFIDYYNFQRAHQGLDGLVPADRYFNAVPEMKQVLAERVQANALQLAQEGMLNDPLYLVGQVGGKQVSLHAKGGKVILQREGEESREVDLGEPGDLAQVVAEKKPVEPVPAAVSVRAVGEDLADHVVTPAPGTSVVDEILRRRGIRHEVADFAGIEEEV